MYSSINQYTHTRHRSAVHQTHVRCPRNLIKFVISLHTAMAIGNNSVKLENSICRQDVCAFACA